MPKEVVDSFIYSQFPRRLYLPGLICEVLRLQLVPVDQLHFVDVVIFGDVSTRIPRRRLYRRCRRARLPGRRGLGAAAAV